MRVLLLVNASASSVTARARVVIRKALAADHDVSLAETDRRGHAQRLAQGASAAGVDVVAVLGGDGTLNEAANGLTGTRTALAVLPGGSTNVFARGLGLPNDPVEATAVLLDSLAAEQRGAPGTGAPERRGADRPGIESVGLGTVNGRSFLFHVGVGYDAAVVRQVERRAHLKRWAGHPLFVVSALTTWLRHYDRSRPRFSVSFPDAADERGDVVAIDDGRFAVVLNASPYTYLGERPLDIAPAATLDRGLVALTVRRLDLWPTLVLVASALGTGGRLRSSPWVDHRSDLTELRVRGYGPVPYQVDGDYLGEVEELDFRHQPNALRLVVPRRESSTGAVLDSQISRARGRPGRRRGRR